MNESVIEKMDETAWSLEAFECVTPALAIHLTFQSIYKMGVILLTS